MAFCTSCGKPIEKAAKFCIHCGEVNKAYENGSAAVMKQNKPAEEKKNYEGSYIHPSVNKIKTMDAIKATMPFIFVKGIVQLIVTLVMIVMAVIGILIITQTGEGGVVVVLILGACFFGIIKFAKRYVLYMIKIANIAALTAYLKTGESPKVQGYSGVLAYGTSLVKENFGSANVGFAADALISGAVHQICRFLFKIGDFLSFIPGLEAVINILTYIIAVALNFIDEAILSYIFFHQEEKNSWKKACDAIVYYGQSWKGMFKGAAKVAFSIWGARIVSFLIFLLIGKAFAATTVAIIISFLLVYALEAIFVEPYMVVVMTKQYYASIENQPLKTDLYEKFRKCSRKFKKLTENSESEEVTAVA